MGALLPTRAGFPESMPPSCSWNPAVRLLPNAFGIGGLVALTILGNMVLGMDSPYRSELMGAGHTIALARLEAVANVARTAVALAASVIGAFAIPGGLLVLAAVRSLGYRRALRVAWQDHTKTRHSPTAPPARQG